MPRKNKNAGKHSENNHSREHIKFEEARHNKKHWQTIKQFFRSNHNLLEVNVDDFILRSGVSREDAISFFGDQPVATIHPEELRKFIRKHDLSDSLIKNIPGAHEASHKGAKEHLQNLLPLHHTMPDAKHPTRAMNKRLINQEINKDLDIS